MDSDFRKARAFLMRAHRYLGGEDSRSRETAEALDLLIINLAAAECSSLGNLRPFRGSNGQTPDSARKKLTA
jgi:hypothetical protein